MKVPITDWLVEMNQMLRHYGAQLQYVVVSALRVDGDHVFTKKGVYFFKGQYLVFVLYRVKFFGLLENADNANVVQFT